MVKLTGYCHSCWDQNIHKFQTSGIIFSNWNVGYVLVSILTVCLGDTAGSNCSCVNDNLMVRGDMISWTAAQVLIDLLNIIWCPGRKCLLIWRSHHYRWRAAKSRPLLDRWAGRDVYRARTALTWWLLFLVASTRPLDLVGVLKSYSNPNPHRNNLEKLSTMQKKKIWGIKVAHPAVSFT